MNETVLSTHGTDRAYGEFAQRYWPATYQSSPLENDLPIDTGLLLGFGLGM